MWFKIGLRPHLSCKLFAWIPRELKSEIFYNVFNNFQILPARIQERNLSLCYAELKNKRDLKEIREKQLQVRDILKALDKRHKVSILVLSSLNFHSSDLKPVDFFSRIYV